MSNVVGNVGKTKRLKILIGHVRRVKDAHRPMGLLFVSWFKIFQSIIAKLKLFGAYWIIYLHLHSFKMYWRRNDKPI